MTQMPASITLGDPQLDQDHEELFRLSRELLDAPSDKALGVLEELHLVAREHFNTEDIDLRKLGGNNVSCHLDEHAAVLKSLSEVIDILRDPTTPEERANYLISSLSMELLRWLPEHIREMDSGLAAQRTKSRFGGAPLLFTPRVSSTT